jgi:molybdopterin converting factor subunit 1
MKTSVLFFATFTERAGTRRIDLELPDRATVCLLKRTLAERLPALQTALDSALIAVNHEYAFDDDLVPADAEIAIFPPVSGG